MSYKGNKNQQTVLGTIVLGLFRGLWWLVSLPFKGLRKKETISLEDKQYIIAKRRQIDELTKSDNQIELRHAVLEADKLVDFVLKKKNYSGQTFADRLRSAENNIPKNVYNNIWDGHKLRNQIAHEDGQINNLALKQAVKNLLSYVEVI